MDIGESNDEPSNNIQDTPRSVRLLSRRNKKDNMGSQRVENNRHNQQGESIQELRHLNHSPRSSTNLVAWLVVVAGILVFLLIRGWSTPSVPGMFIRFLAQD